jgi:hypothetical protein
MEPSASMPLFVSLVLRHLAALSSGASSVERLAGSDS